MEGLTLARPGGKSLLLDNVSFSVRAGEMLGIYGLMGAGRTELLEFLIGVRPELRAAFASTAKSSSGPQDLRAHTPRTGARARGPPASRTRANPLGGREHDPRQPAQLHPLVLSLREERTPNVKRTIAELSIKVYSPNQLITALSGGNQQKVVVGKALLTSPRVLLLDEPTRGIDVGAKADMFGIMSDLAAKGLGVVFVSSELMEVLAMSDRILVMSKGTITGEFMRGEATEEALVAASAVGHQPYKPEPDVTSSMPTTEATRTGAESNGD